MSPLPRLDAAVPVVVMGVSGCGKSTVGAALAAHLRRPFLDGDTLHPEANLWKMGEGVPLTDADRRPWLDACNAELRARPALVLGCSALRRVYRDRLRAGFDAMHFIHLHATEEQLRPRMENRPGHFMPPELLRSQLDTLEMPPPQEALTLDATWPVDQLVAAAGEFIASSRR